MGSELSNLEGVGEGYFSVFTVSKVHVLEDGIWVSGILRHEIFFGSRTNYDFYLGRTIVGGHHDGPSADGPSADGSISSSLAPPIECLFQRQCHECLFSTFHLLRFNFSPLLMTGEEFSGSCLASQSNSTFLPGCSCSIRKAAPVRFKFSWPGSMGCTKSLADRHI